MANDLTPEGRLLRLIRGKPKKSDTVFQSQEAQSKIGTSHTVKLTEIFEKIFRLTKLFTFKRMSIVLAIVIILFLGYAIFALLAPQPSLNLEEFRTSTIEDRADKELSQISPIKPYSYYSQQIEARDIFNAPFLSDRVADASSDSSLGKRVADLALVGIVLDEAPQAIIEDKKENKTYFLNKGDSLGEIKIEDILENKVILSYGDEKFEMVP